MSNTNNGSDTSNNSLWNYASRIWQHSQRVIKGVTLVTVGVIGYNFFGLLSNSMKTKSDSLTTSHETDLVENSDVASTSGLVEKKLNELSLTSTYTVNTLHNPNINPLTSSLIANLPDPAFELAIDYPQETANKLNSNSPTTRSNKSANNQRDLSKKSLTNLNGTLPLAIRFTVNKVQLYSQINPALAALSNGNAYVVWQSDGQDGSTYGVFMNQLDPYGQKLNDEEILVNTHTELLQREPAIAVSLNDTILVSWTGTTYDGYIDEIYAQRFDSSGTKLGNEFRINDFTPNQQYQSYLRNFPNGNFLATWTSYDQDAVGGYRGVIGRILDINGNKLFNEFVVNTYTDNEQLDSASITLSNNNYVIAWDALYHPGDDFMGVYFRLYDSNNNGSSEQHVNTYIAGSQFAPSITKQSNDNFIIVYQSSDQVGSSFNYDIFGQRFLASGAKLGGEFRVNTLSQGNQVLPKVISLNNDNFLVMWQSDPNNSDDHYTGNYTIKAQFIASDGTKLGSEFQVTPYNTGNQNSPGAVQLTNSNLLFVWSNNIFDSYGFDIHSRILMPDFSLFAYNLNIPKTYTENITFQFSDLIVNPMVDADTINATLTLSDPSVGLLSLESSNNITAIFDSTQGVWQVQNAGIVDLNRILEQLKFIPSVNFNSDFSIQVDLTDSNINHSTYSNTLTMLGIPVNDAPILMTNQLALNQGDKITLGLNNINATDVDNPQTDLTFSITQPLQGQFQLVSNPGRAIANFTFNDLVNRQIIFIHDNTRFAPTYQISVSDGNLTTSPQPANVDFNARPELVNNQLSINGGETVILTQDNLKASDDHTAEDKLVFMMSEVTHGQFEIVSAQGAAITQFMQQQVIEGQVQFVHDGSTQAPSFKTSIYDGRISSEPVTVTINFVANTSSVTNNSADNTLPIALGVSIGGAALLAGAGIGIWQGKKQQQLRQEREQEPLANAVRSKLRVGNVDDFKSSQGRNYINFINTLKNELINVGIEVGQMLPDEINELAGFISDAIKETMKENGIKHKKTVTGAIELNIQSLQTYASTIAAKTQEYKNESQGISYNGTALKTINPVVNV